MEGDIPSGPSLTSARRAASPNESQPTHGDEWPPPPSAGARGASLSLRISLSPADSTDETHLLEAGSPPVGAS